MNSKITLRITEPMISPTITKTTDKTQNKITINSTDKIVNSNISKTKDKTVNIVINKTEKISNKTLIKIKNKTMSITERLRISNNITNNKKRDSLKSLILLTISTGT